MSFSAYYGLMFMVAAFLQDSFEGFLPSLWIAGCIFVSSSFFVISTSAGFGFISTAILLELFIMIPSLLFYNTRLGKVIVAVCGVSILLHVFLLFCSMDMYAWIQQYYSVINILLVEIILLTSLSQSKIKEFIKFLFKKKEVEK